ncbi:MAG: DNA topoisomerase III [Clostridiales bacterium]|nr:DNA topoisomerase III [Clostridiales bacterium]
MKSLIIAEKPSVAKDIAKALKCNNHSKSSIEGPNYVITWALGHLVTLRDPEGYDKRYKEWKLDYLPIIPKKPELEVIGKTAFQYKAIKDLIQSNNIGDIIIATDAGREGELVARWILEKAGNRKPIKRLWISSVTNKAILDGFKSLKDGKLYLPLFKAAEARAEADWLVGINATRALTTKFNAQLSCGRVQTPTLAMVYSKEGEIRSFRPKDYYLVKFKANNAEFTYQDKQGSSRIFDKQMAEDMVNTLKNKKCAVINIEKNVVKEREKGLYDLTLLQRDANNMYGFSPKQTLDIAQSLYERHKVLTYPRTDSCYIPKDIVATIPERLRAIRFGAFKNFAVTIINSGKYSSPSFVDDSKVSDHHAIIPTEEAVEPSALSDNEMKIYAMVIKRFLACMMPAYEYEKLKVTAKALNHTFIASGRRVINPGFKEVYGVKNDIETIGDIKEQILPEFKNNQEYDILRPSAEKRQTTPPPYFTEGTLVYAMENPKAYLQSKTGEYAKTLGETGGLGTVATRADIIEKLFNAFYIEKRGNSLFTTPKGRQVLRLAPMELRSPDLTVQWEQKLTLIAKAKLDKNKFIEEIKGYTNEIITRIKSSGETFVHDNITGKKCPDCGKFLLEVNGKRGKMLVCQDRECGYRKSLSVNTNARCPNCHKKLSLIGEGEARQFVCACGYRERLSAFEKRREQDSNALNKKDVEKYLDKMNKEDKGEKEVNSKMADALKGFKF